MNEGVLIDDPQEESIAIDCTGEGRIARSKVHFGHTWSPIRLKVATPSDPRSLRAFDPGFVKAFRTERLLAS